jgi:hypothetical protein
MMFQELHQWNTSDAGWNPTADGWAPSGAFDMGSTYPMLQNTDEILWWLQVYSAPTSGSTTYQFILCGYATLSSSDLAASTSRIILTPAWVNSGTFLQKTGPEAGWFSVIVPENARAWRYWEVYCDYTSGNGANDLYVLSGLTLKSAGIHRRGNVSQNSGITVA